MRCAKESGNWLGIDSNKNINNPFLHKIKLFKVQVQGSHRKAISQESSMPLTSGLHQRGRCYHCLTPICSCSTHSSPAAECPLEELQGSSTQPPGFSCTSGWPSHCGHWYKLQYLCQNNGCSSCRCQPSCSQIDHWSTPLRSRKQHKLSTRPASKGAPCTQGHCRGTCIHTSRQHTPRGRYSYKDRASESGRCNPVLPTHHCKHSALAPELSCCTNHDPISAHTQAGSGSHCRRDP